MFQIAFSDNRSVKIEMILVLADFTPNEKRESVSQFELQPV